MTTLTAQSRLSNHLQKILEKKLRERDPRAALRIWLDVDGVYSDFVSRLSTADFFADVVAFQGSYIETLAQLEDKANGLDPEPLLLHLPGHNPESVRQTPLLEIYHAGLVFQKNLHTLVKEAAVGLVAPEKIRDEVPGLSSFQAAETWLEDALVGQRDQALTFDMAPEDFVYSLLTAPQSLEERAGSKKTLVGYWSLKTGMLPKIQEHLNNRFLSLEGVVVGWLLLMEYAFDLKREPSGILAPIKKQKAFEAVCKRCLARVRDSFEDKYCDIANELEAWKPLLSDLSGGKADELGKIDTFRYEDQRLLGSALLKIQEREWKPALTWSQQRLKAKSVWLRREPAREQLWKFVIACSELGRLCSEADPDLKACRDHYEVVQLYSNTLYQVDRAHRVVEQLYDGLQAMDDLVSVNKSREVVGKLYHEWSDQLSRQFNTFCLHQGFLPSSELQQRNLYEELVHPMVVQNEKSAYFLVDALRYEMGVELEERLTSSTLVSRLTARLAELPTETRVGMNALAPVAQGGKLTLKSAFKGFTYDSFTVNSPKQRIRAMGHRSLAASTNDKKTPTSFTIKELITSSAEHVVDKVKKARMIVVVSKEIDTAGERDFGYATFDETLGKIASAVRVLHNAGVRHFVVASDHGFGVNDPRATSISYKNGKPTRRYVLADKGASVCTDAFAVPLRELSYQGVDKVLILPWDGRNFESPGQNAENFYHGGNSLQERVIPVLQLEYQERGRRTERPRYTIEASLNDISGETVRLSLRVREQAAAATQLVLTEAGEQSIRLMFSGLNPDDSVTLSATSTGVIENGQLVIPAGKLIDNVFLQIKGTVRGLRLSHPDGEYDIAPLELQFKCGPTAEPSDENWQDSISNPHALKILLHIEKHGSITEAEIVDLTDSTRAPRRFAKLHQDDKFSHLPFRLKIDTAQETTYIKD